MMLYTRQYWANNSPNNFGMGQVRQRVSTGRAKNFPISSVIFTFHILSFQRGWKLQPRVPALLLSTILNAGLRRPKGQQGISFCRLAVYGQDSDNQKRCATSRPLRVIFSMNQCPLSGLLRANWHFSLHLRCHHEKAIEKHSAIAGHIFKGELCSFSPHTLRHHDPVRHCTFRFSPPESRHGRNQLPCSPILRLSILSTKRSTFNFAFPTTLNDARPYSRNNPYMQE